MDAGDDCSGMRSHQVILVPRAGSATSSVFASRGIEAHSHDFSYLLVGCPDGRAPGPLVDDVMEHPAASITI